MLFRSQKAAAIAASCNILPMNQDLFQVGVVCCVAWALLLVLWERVVPQAAAETSDNAVAATCGWCRPIHEQACAVGRGTLLTVFYPAPFCVQVHPAPGPEEVNWESLWFNHSQRLLRQFVTTPFAILVVFAPVSLLTSAISSLNRCVWARALGGGRSPISLLAAGAAQPTPAAATRLLRFPCDVFIKPERVSPPCCCPAACLSCVHPFPSLQHLLPGCQV